MKKQLSVGCTTLALLATGGALTSVRADTIISTLPEYTSSGFPSYPSDLTTIGTFTYTLPVGQDITSITYSGQTGNSAGAATAPFSLYLNNILIKQVTTSDIEYAGGPHPFSYTFSPSDFSSFAGGSATLAFVQTDDFYVHLGQSTLTIITPQSTPAPASLLTAGMGGL